MGQAKRTTNHEEIKKWAERRNGRPARVVGTGNGDDAGLMRIDFPEADDNDESLEEISWAECYEKFDEKHLAFLSEAQSTDGKRSYLHKPVSR